MIFKMAFANTHNLFDIDHTMYLVAFCAITVVCVTLLCMIYRSNRIVLCVVIPLLGLLGVVSDVIIHRPALGKATMPAWLFAMFIGGIRVLWPVALITASVVRITQIVRRRMRREAFGKAVDDQYESRSSNPFDFDEIPR